MQRSRNLLTHTLIFLTAVKGHNVPGKGVDYDDYVVVSYDAGDTLSHDVMTLQPSPVTSHHHTCSEQTLTKIFYKHEIKHFQNMD